MILINGEFKAHIEVSDRGFQYGDGLFETIAVAKGQPIFFNQHLKRLSKGCSRLHIPFPGSELLTTEAKKLCAHTEAAVLKIILTRGTGGRGYRQPDEIKTTRVLSLHPFPDYPDNYKEQGIVARFCDTPLGLNPRLAGIKHLNRLEQIMARSEWNNPAIQEGIMLDINGHVIEGTMTNLFYLKNKQLYTSSIEASGVAGIMRGLIISVAAKLGLTTIEHNFTQDELLSANEVFVCNSIIGIWPVKQIGKVHFTVGEETQLLQDKLIKLRNEDIKVDL